MALCTEWVMSIISIIPVAVNFGTSVSASAFEFVLIDALSTIDYLSKEPQIIVLNFSETEFIDIVSTQYITAFVLTAKSRNWLIILRPPKSKNVRDFWRHWNYPQAFKLATGMNFASLFSGEDRAILKEPQTTYSDDAPLEIGVPDEDEDEDETHDSTTRSISEIAKSKMTKRERSKRFFGFVSQPIDGVDASNLANFQADGWTIPEVQNVLDRYLENGADYIPSRIVFEAFFNAAKHPNATIVQTVSWKKELTRRLDRKSISDNGYFNCVFWDNGDSIESTLSKAIDDGVTVRQEYSTEFDKKYYFEYQDKGNLKESYTSHLHTRCSLNKKTPKEVVFASAIFPGVTSRPDSKLHAAPKELEKFDIRLAKRGMGLYVFVNAIVGVMGGEVSFRSGQYFMNVSKLGPIKQKQLGAKYKIKVVKQPNYLPLFYGNMIWIRLNSRIKKRD